MSPVDLSTGQPPTHTAQRHGPALPLAAHGIRVRRGGRVIVDSVDLHLPAGQIAVVIGPNGAGKSTLLHAVAGILPLAAGSIRLGDTTVADLPRRERARRIALVQQQVEAESALTVRDVVLLSRIPHLPRLAAPSLRDQQLADDALDQMDAAELADRVFGELSGGEKQRVLLARALAQQPSLLLLDEPTNHLDVHAQLATLALVRWLADQGMTVLAAIHDLNLAARVADQLVVLCGGEVVAAGPPATVLTTELMAEVYRVRAEVLADSSGTPVISFAPLP